jgi:hypothetical protein
VRDLLHAGKIIIPVEYQRLANQLREVIKKPIAGGGLRIISPHKGNVHGDIVSAFVLAIDRIDVTPEEVRDYSPETMIRRYVSPIA